MFDVSSGPERDKLIDFVNDLNDFIRNHLLEAKRFFIHIDFVDDFTSLWNSDENQDRFPRMHNMITNSSDAALHAHGLIGSEPDIKIKAARHLFERWMQRGGTFLLKKLIDAIDTLLDSIIEAVGFGGAIKELKDLLKNIIEED